MKSYTVTLQNTLGSIVIIANSEDEVQQKLRRLTSRSQYDIQQREVGRCACGELEDQEVLDHLGECMRCDHIRADVIQDHCFAYQDSVIL